MKRVPSDSPATPAVRNNPDIFGEDLIRLGWKAVGLTATSFLNKALVSPVVSRLVPAGADPTGGKLTDAGATAITAWGLGEGVGMVSGPVGRDVKLGGLVLFAGKLISVVIPNFSIDAQFPNVKLPGAPAPKQVAAPNGNVTQFPVPSGAVAGKRVMGI